MRTRQLSLVTSLALGLLVISAVLLVLGSESPGISRAQHDVITVCVNGGCDHRTIQAAVNAAREGDLIKVAAGRYDDLHRRPAPDGYPNGTVVTQVVYVDKNVIIQGGYTEADWATPDPEANATVVDAQGQGRGLFIAEPSSGVAITPVVAGLQISGGDAYGLRGHPSFPDTDAGGGAYVFSVTATITDSQILENRADWGGGLYLYRSKATLQGNEIFSNTTIGISDGGGLYLYESPAILSCNAVLSNSAGYAGGGLYGHRSPVTLTRNSVVSNTAASYGGGLYLKDGEDASMKGNVIRNNAAHRGGGIYLNYSDAELTLNAIDANSATGSHGGGLYLERSTAVISANLFVSNTAELFGGGLHLYRTYSLTLTNNVVADNRAGASGSGVYVWRSGPRLLHTTIARNRGGDGTGVVVRNDGKQYWTTSLTNTILVSHTVGISVARGGVVKVNGILWDQDTITRVSRSALTTTVSVQNQLTGDPAFAPDGYHLLPDSAAVDEGIDTDVAVDIDGESRPMGAGYDLGADEMSPLLFASFTHSAPHWVGEATIFTNTTIVSGPVSYRWDLGDGASSTAVHPTHIYTSAGSYTVVLTATSGDLQDVASRKVIIYGASFTSSSPDWLGQTTVFTNTSAAGDEARSLWSFGDGVTTTGEHPTHTYERPGLYTVTLTVTNDAGSGVAKDLVALYGASFTSSSPDWLGQTTVFTNTSAAGDEAYPLWSFGDGVTTTGEHPTHTYERPGLYTVTLTVTNEAGSSVATGLVALYGVSFTSSSPDWLGQTTVFTNTSAAGDEAHSLWSFGDGVTTTGEHPTHTYERPGLYTVTLTVTNEAGSGAATGLVALYGAPEVDFFAWPRQGLAPLQVSFRPVVSTTPPGDPSLRYLWHFAVGDQVDESSSLPEPVHTYVTTGVYTVSLRVTNNLTSGMAIKPRHIVVQDTIDIYLPLVARDS